MNPLQRAGEAVGRGWHKSVRGTTRTAAWVKDGVSGAFGSARDRVSALRSSGEKPAPAKAEGRGKGSPGPNERTGIGGLLERARADQRIAIAWIAGGVLLLAWIGWTIYVWSSNGSNAGLGVLISWPALFAAAAIVAAPFVGATVLVRRHQAGAEGSAAIVGGGSAAEVEPEVEDESDDGAKAKAGEESGESDPEPEDDEDTDEEEPEAD